MAYFARIYTACEFKIAVFVSLPCLLLLITFLSRICDGVLHNYPTYPRLEVAAGYLTPQYSVFHGLGAKSLMGLGANIVRGVENLHLLTYAPKAP